MDVYGLTHKSMGFGILMQQDWQKVGFLFLLQNFAAWDELKVKVGLNNEQRTKHSECNLREGGLV